jgi:transcriptional regulator with XRE-family HTH domain
MKSRLVATSHLLYGSGMAGRRELGERIRAARAEKGWKQKHLASQVSVEPITVSRWERGATTPDLDALGLVAEATGKPLGYFVDQTRAGRDEVPMVEATARLDAAADRLVEATERISAILAEVRDELAALRARS